MGKYTRIMLKLSGEILQGVSDGGSGGGIGAASLKKICEVLKKISESGIQIALVVGGGNFWRYKDQKDLGFDRVTSDTIGMMATVMNAMAIEEQLTRIGVRAISFSALPVPKALETYVQAKARAAFHDHEVVLCAGGTGNPYFTTDSAAALRALELGCDIMLKATKIDYVCDKDPKKYPDAKVFEKLTYQQVLEMGLEVMDLSAVSLCMDNNLPILVFNMEREGNLLKAAFGEHIGTLITK